jgi:hypothetical protein
VSLYIQQPWLITTTQRVGLQHDSGSVTTRRVLVSYICISNIIMLNQMQYLDLAKQSPISYSRTLSLKKIIAAEFILSVTVGDLPKLHLFVPPSATRLAPHQIVSRNSDSIPRVTG